MIGLRIKSLSSKFKHLFSSPFNIFQNDGESIVPLFSQIHLINCSTVLPFLEPIKEIKAKASKFIRPLNCSSYCGRDRHEAQYAFHSCKQFNLWWKLAFLEILCSHFHQYVATPELKPRTGEAEACRVWHH